MKEEFKPYGPDPSIKVGNLGTILNAEGNVITHSIHNTGGRVPQIEVSVKVAGKWKIKRVNRMIAELFVANETGLPMTSLSIIPKDGDILNLFAGNLMWATGSEYFLFSKNFKNNVRVKEHGHIPEPDEKNDFGGAF